MRSLVPKVSNKLQNACGDDARERKNRETVPAILLQEKKEVILQELSNIRVIDGSVNHYEN